MPAPSTSTISSSWESWDTLSPWLASSATSGPAIATDSSAGITVINGASSDLKITSSSSRMKISAANCTWLPVLPDCFCWSTWIAIWPARCTSMPGGGDESVIAVRRLPTRSVTALLSLRFTVESTCSCAAWPSTPFGPGTCDSPSRRAFVTVGTLARSVVRVAR